MGAYVAGRMVKAMLKRHIEIEGARILVLGLTFKENCPDLRITRVVDLVLEQFPGFRVLGQSQPGHRCSVTLVVLHHVKPDPCRVMIPASARAFAETAQEKIQLQTCAPVKVSLHTPIFYQFDMMPTQVQNVLQFSPMVQIVTMAHHVVLYGTLPSINTILYAIGSISAITAIGYLIFRKYQAKIVEEV